jgi:hypothetical protein
MLHIDIDKRYCADRALRSEWLRVAVHSSVTSSEKLLFYVFYECSKIVQVWNTKTMNILNTFELKYNINLRNKFSILKNNNIICKSENIIIKYHTPFSIIEFLKINTNILPNEIWDYILVLI